MYKVTLRGGRCFGPETLLGPTGLAERGVSTWLPRMPRLPAQPARGRLPDLTPPTGANGPPTWSALQTPSRVGTLPPAPRLTKRYLASSMATSFPLGAQAGARAGPWAKARAPRAGIRGAAC